MYGTAHTELLCVWCYLRVQTLVACICLSAWAVAWRRRPPPYFESPPVCDGPNFQGSSCTGPPQAYITWAQWHRPYTDFTLPGSSCTGPPQAYITWAQRHRPYYRLYITGVQRHRPTTDLHYVGPAAQALHRLTLPGSSSTGFPQAYITWGQRHRPSTD